MTTLCIRGLGGANLDKKMSILSIVIPFDESLFIFTEVSRVYTTLDHGRGRVIDTNLNTYSTNYCHTVWVPTQKKDMCPTEIPMLEVYFTPTNRNEGSIFSLSTSVTGSRVSCPSQHLV